MAKAQISTIQYSVTAVKSSPRNILAPDLGSSLNSKPLPLQRNNQLITLGLTEAESTEDVEAQRNRNINLNELQSLLT